MGIRDSGSLTEGAGDLDAEYTATSIAELDGQFARGEIEAHAYFLKKRALVSLYLKSTTKPIRKKRGDYDEL